MNNITIICHILTSLNGKIAGPFMNAKETRALSGEYARIRDDLKSDALLYGTQTMKDFVGLIDNSNVTDNAPAEGNYINIIPNLPFIISIDVEGELGFKSNILKRGNTDYKILEVISTKVSDAYRNHLKKLGISYITAGDNALDPVLLLKILNEKFPIKTILLCGGGKINWTFLEYGLISKLSLVVTPVVDNKKGTPSVFDSITQDSLKSYSFKLESLKRLPNNGVYLLYEI